MSKLSSVVQPELRERQPCPFAAVCPAPAVGERPRLGEECSTLYHLRLGQLEEMQSDVAFSGMHYGPPVYQYPLPS